MSRSHFAAWSKGNSTTLTETEHGEILENLEEILDHFGEHEITRFISAESDALDTRFNKEALAKLAVYVSVLIFKYKSTRGAMRKELEKIMVEIRPKEVTAADIADML